MGTHAKGLDYSDHGPGSSYVVAELNLLCKAQSSDDKLMAVRHYMPVNEGARY